MRAFKVVLVVKNLPANAGAWDQKIQSLGVEDPLEKGMATHSSTLAWRILRTEETGGLQSMDLKESDTTAWLTPSLFTDQELTGLLIFIS